MKLIDYLIFPAALAFFVMGIYEAMVLGIGHAYGFFMLSLGLLFWFGYRKNQRETKK